MLIVASCHRGAEPFSIEATYDAPKSGVRAIVWSTGTVAAGRDLAEGVPATAILCPKTKAGHPIGIDVKPPNDPRREPTVSVLTKALDGAGYALPDPTELAELADTIDAVPLGPKGTRIAGQTHQLVVASVSFEAHAAPTIESCAP